MSEATNSTVTRTAMHGNAQVLVSMWPHPPDVAHSYEACPAHLGSCLVPHRAAKNACPITLRGWGRTGLIELAFHLMDHPQVFTFFVAGKTPPKHRRNDRRSTRCHNDGIPVARNSKMSQARVHNSQPQLVKRLLDMHVRTNQECTETP